MKLSDAQQAMIERAKTDTLISHMRSMDWVTEWTWMSDGARVSGNTAMSLINRGLMIRTRRGYNTFWYRARLTV